MAERAPDEMQWSDGDRKERKEFGEQILHKNANEVKVMASITRLCCFLSITQMLSRR